MANLRLCLFVFVALWFIGRSPVDAQTDDGSGNNNQLTGIASCCYLYSEQATCFEICAMMHATGDVLDPVLRNCSEMIFDKYEMCIHGFLSMTEQPTNATPTTEYPATSLPPVTPVAYRCCDKANSTRCRWDCQRLLLANGSEEERYNELVRLCGHDRPIFTCFLGVPTPTVTPVPPNRQPVDLIRRRCCQSAVSDYCRRNCIMFYEDNTVDESWRAVEGDCIHRPEEWKLASCLADVSYSCKLGCTDMSFCSTFNNRPNELFRQCNQASDRHAKNQYHTWQDERNFTLLNSVVSIKDVSKCLPDMWKALACFYHTEPCHPVTLSTFICRRDCIKLFSECGTGFHVDRLCDKLSSSSDDNCLPLSNYTDSHKPVSVRQPCSSNPCARGEVCLINKCSPDDLECVPYKCIPGCSLGNNVHDIVSVIVPNNTVVKIQLPDDENCTSYVQCNSQCLYDSYTLQSTGTGLGNHCHHQDHCTVHGAFGPVYQHGETFELDCQSCYCNYGNIICSNKTCVVPLCPNCSMEEYNPVCAPNGQTLPSRCVAVCQGWREDQLRTGFCANYSACERHTCPVRTRCVEDRRVCMGKSGNCAQYSCERFTCTLEAQPVCDTSGLVHAHLCSLLTHNKQLAYRGFCEKDCKNSGPVCGMDGNVYTSRCHANSYHVAVNYMGVCRGTTTEHCKDVVCPKLPNENCDGHGVVPPGACCPVCGGMVEVLIDTHHLHRTAQHLELPQIAVQDILQELNSRLSTVECTVLGHIALDGTLVVLSVPTKANATSMMVEVCNAEAVLITSCINNKSPLYLSSPLLSHLLQAVVSTSQLPTNKSSIVGPTQSPKGSSASRFPDMMLMVYLLTASFLLCVR
ncbi:reversion-inducing cysteine-rich protein with Kazal motifs-like [Dysidea avara]|uniref:reversion-inducing cysteine-rich protein with Kazal motifs-like n=1 Tax=Dysidea avara TaxID=196820 RepID=UPI00333323B6